MILKTASPWPSELSIFIDRYGRNSVQEMPLPTRHCEITKRFNARITPVKAIFSYGRKLISTRIFHISCWVRMNIREGELQITLTGVWKVFVCAGAGEIHHCLGGYIQLHLLLHCKTFDILNVNISGHYITACEILFIYLFIYFAFQ
jgi:hypothetical protein